MEQTIQIISVPHMRANMNKDDLELYKVKLCNAICRAPTELEKEPLRNHVNVVNSLLNESKHWRQL